MPERRADMAEETVQVEKNHPAYVDLPYIRYAAPYALKPVM